VGRLAAAILLAGGTAKGADENSRSMVSILRMQAGSTGLSTRSCPCLRRPGAPLSEADSGLVANLKGVHADLGRVTIESTGDGGTVLVLPARPARVLRLVAPSLVAFGLSALLLVPAWQGWMHNPTPLLGRQLVVTTLLMAGFLWLPVVGICVYTCVCREMILMGPSGLGVTTLYRIPRRLPGYLRPWSTIDEIATVSLPGTVLSNLFGLPRLVIRPGQPGTRGVGASLTSEEAEAVAHYLQTEWTRRR
jgi:hypothetical protein